MLNIIIWGIDPDTKPEILSDLRERLTNAAMANRRWGLNRRHISVRFPTEHMGEQHSVFIQVEAHLQESTTEMIGQNSIDTMCQMIFDKIYECVEASSTFVSLRFTHTMMDKTPVIKFICEDGQKGIDEQIRKLG